MTQLRVLDLFSGIGGFSLGLERTGMRTVAFCEIDSFCRRVLAKHWPDVPCHDDVTTREFQEGEADVICAGFPCQDISFAGDGTGLAGSRSGLYREVIRAIRLVRPQFTVLENVAALLCRGLGTVLGDLAEIGHDTEWNCIPASAVGAPHRRDRIWIVAHPGGEQHESCRTPFSGEIAAQLSSTTPDTNGSQLWEQSVCELERSCATFARANGATGCVADAFSVGELQSQGRFSNVRGWPSNGGWWSAEPDVGRVADGVPARVDRLRGLGNAVVPQIPEILGTAIARAVKRATQEG